MQRCSWQLGFKINVFFDIILTCPNQTYKVQLLMKHSCILSKKWNWTDEIHYNRILVIQGCLCFPCDWTVSKVVESGHRLHQWTSSLSIPHPAYSLNELFCFVCHSLSIYFPYNLPCLLWSSYLSTLVRLKKSWAFFVQFHISHILVTVAQWKIMRIKCHLKWVIKETIRPLN